MVNFNWRIDVVCASPASFEFFPNHEILEYRITSVLFLLSVIPFDIQNNCLDTLLIISFSQISGLLPFSFTIFFVRGGRKLFQFFCTPRMIIKPFYSSLCECNACTVSFYFLFFTKTLVVIEVCLFPIMSGRLNARTRFRAMAEESIPLNNISFGETSASQPVDRESQLVRFFFCFLVL